MGDGAFSDFEQIFELAPVSLWLEDYSGIRALFDTWRAEGVSDLAAMFRTHPERLRQCAHSLMVLRVNQRTLAMFEAPSQHELLGQLDRLFRDDSLPMFAHEMQQLWDGHLALANATVNYTLSGRRLDIHLEARVLAGHEATWKRVLVSLQDVTARKRDEARLAYLSAHDSLTHLHNRSHFTEAVEQLARTGPWPASVLALDLNGLKQANDTQGHAAGDTLLRRAAMLLRDAVGPAGCLARTGGDEFAVLLPATDEAGAQAMRQRIDAELARDNLRHPEQPLSLAVGVATCQDGPGLDAALQQADHEMYADKARHYARAGIERRRT